MNIKTTPFSVTPFEIRFHQGFRFAVVGSTIYEATKTIHNLLLIYYLTPKAYGLIASALSFIYLVTKFADFGASSSILPFFHLFIKDKCNFKYLTLRHYLLPHIPALLIAAAISTIFLWQYKRPGTNSTILLIITTIIFLETIRSFLRLFLYTSLECKKTVFIDVSSFLFYVLLIWIPFFLFNLQLSLSNILTIHIIDSLFTCSVFSLFFYKIYKKLPSNQLSLPNNFKSRLLKTKIFNYLLRLSRELFTANFLTPFFAIKFGFIHAGLFYLAAVIAHSINSIFKISIGYLGNAILANLKNSSISEKQKAFGILTQKLSTLICPLVIILLINYNKIIYYASCYSIDCSGISTTTLSLALLFFIIQMIDFTLSLYEQFYVMEEASHQFFFYKLFEFLFFYFFMSACNQSISQPNILLGIISIKLVSFILIAASAFYRWQIKPKFKANLRYISLSLVIGFLAFFIL